MVAPIEAGDADAVFGSRMMTRGHARRGGMPLYKVVGNTVLTAMQNLVVGEHLSEWHSGYRAYRVSTLAALPFEQLSPDYNFDTQIILQLHEARRRIVEIPIPTFYGDEISYVNGMRYARQCAIDVTKYRAHRMGLGTGAMAFATGDDDASESVDRERVQGQILQRLSGEPPGRVADLGCGDGALAQALRKVGHHVVGVDRVEHPDARARTDDLVVADLDEGIPPALGDGLDAIVAVDVLGCVRDPVALLREAATRLRPGGRLYVSVANFGHWYPRARVALGRFDYDRKGILDKDHLRFFTARSARRRFAEAGLEVQSAQPVALPIRQLARRSRGDDGGGRAVGVAARADQLGMALAPSLFAYQYLFELTPDRYPSAP
jgi:SAM-dependent methyltransferase